MSIRENAQQVKKAAIQLGALKTDNKNKALAEIASSLQQEKDRIIAANQEDLKNAKENNLAAPLLKRLRFDQDKINVVCNGITSLIQLADPVGKTLNAMELDKGLELFQVSCPIGVIGVIFESRPDALVQISTLCLKSGNAVLLKGGSEALQTNRILAQVIRETTEHAGIPAGWIQLLETREDVDAILGLDEWIDLIIPRGSNAFVRYIMDHTNIPVLGHADGICHVYVDGKADLDMAVKITMDSKCQYVAVCNAAETLLVDQTIAETFLPKVVRALQQHNTEIRGCDKTRAIIHAKPAGESDWQTEYLDYILSIKVVSGLDQAIDFINTHGSRHTDTIITEDAARARQFMDLVDAANVFWNCSTRFSDGYRYGLGAEVGVSTNKIHARGPVGLEGLVIYKWRLIGKGHVVSDYAMGMQSFTHKPLNKDFSI